MWQSRAEGARREIAALATSGLGVADLHATALGVVQRAVPFDQACWAGVDPASMVMTSVANWRPWPVRPDLEVVFAETEYAGTEPNSFAQLVRREVPVVRTHDLPHREVARSVRLQELVQLLGLRHEVRAVFRADGTCWGVGGLFRSRGGDFTDREVEFLIAVAPVVGAATRVAVRTAGGRGKAGVADGPVVVLVGSRGHVRAATPAAVTWLEAVEDAAPGRFAMTLYAIVAGARTADSGTARARMRDAAGGWVVLQASRLLGEPDQMVVTVEPAPPAHLVDLLLTAYGLSPREREVCGEVLAGRSTADIAARLFLSPHTVQDHLKAVFGKVGVHSRGELAARLLQGE